MNDDILPLLSGMIAGTIRPRAVGWQAWPDSFERAIARAVAENRPLGDAFSNLPRGDRMRLAFDLADMIDTGAARDWRLAPYLEMSRRRCVEMLAVVACEDYVEKRIELHELKERICKL